MNQDLKNLIEELKQNDKDGLLTKSNLTFLDKLQVKINRVISFLSADTYKQEASYFSRNFRKAYKKIKKEIPERNVGISSYKLKELNPKFEKEYKSSSLLSLNLISTQNSENMLKLKRRFQDWIIVKAKGDDKGVTLNQKDLLPKNNKIKFILRDQSNKLSSNIDDIVAKEYEAIAFQWKTRNDNRVVGKPGGKYPTAKSDDDMHGNHWERKDKYYYYSNTWATKGKLLNIKKFKGNNLDIPDGMPGKPIGCRCYAKNIYRLQDLPEECLSEKGVDFLKSK